MDEDDVVKAGMEVMLKPVTDIAENALGLVGGDWLSEKRMRNRARLKAKTEEILRARNVEMDIDPSPTVVVPLLTAAQDEGREELLDLWATLLAAGSDPSRRNRYRREFVDIAKRMETSDALLLKGLGARAHGVYYDERMAFAVDLGLTDDQLAVSIDNLSTLGLLEKKALGQGVVQASPLAREMCFALEAGTNPTE